MVQHSSAKNNFPAGNPIANALVVVAGVLAIAASIVLGFFAFLALGALVLVAGAVIGLRVWWLKRKMGLHPRSQPRTDERTSKQSVIEGEYRVVQKDRDEA